ncbi:MAG: chemotaxis protein CheD [Lachnospiraceae bacterium]|nr:chemotaxis protein CheD [Lachnospiraceae bacterium]
MDEIIKVGMADMQLCEPPKGITTLGLGSCVGIVLYDVKTRLSGMVHIMLPDSTKIKNNLNRAKFADTGIQDMLELMMKKGSAKENIVAKIAGGAQMFSYGSGCNEIMRVGEKNVEAVKNILNQFNIRIISEDTGLNYGRTIIFNPSNGNLIIRAVGKPEKII